MLFPMATGILNQPDDQGHLHPVGYWSKKSSLVAAPSTDHFPLTGDTLGEPCDHPAPPAWQVSGISRGPMVWCECFPPAYAPNMQLLERVANQVLSNFPRSYCHDKPKTWPGLLLEAEFACNNAKNSATNSTPFRLLYGYGPS